MGFENRILNIIPGVKPQYDATGLRVGKLIVLGYSHKEKGELLYKCLCDCGNVTYGNSFRLRNGRKISCGCGQYRKGAEVYNYKGFEEITGSFWNSQVTNAKFRKLDHRITKEQVWEMFICQNRKCKLSGVEISFKLKTASIDRIDSKKGYLMNNIQLVHKDINLMKNHFNQEYFITMCNLIANINQP